MKTRFWEVKRVNNDSNWNPRYVVHYIDIGLDKYKATKYTREAWFSIYRGKDFGGWFVFSTYADIDEHLLWAVSKMKRLSPENVCVIELYGTPQAIEIDYLNL